MGIRDLDMEDLKHFQVPLVAHFRLCKLYCPKTGDERLEMLHTPYANAVGCLMYAMVLIKLDILHVVSVISRYMASLGKKQWKGVKWILRYLRGPLKLGLLYGRKYGAENDRWGYVDSIM